MLLLRFTRGQESRGDCFREKIPLDELVHKRTYRIAVHAIRGFESALQYYNTTFEAYLSATAGQRFDPPIEFELVPVEFNGLFEAVEDESVDFSLWLVVHLQETDTLDDRTCVLPCEFTVRRCPWTDSLPF